MKLRVGDMVTAIATLGEVTLYDAQFNAADDHPTKVAVLAPGEPAIVVGLSGRDAVEAHVAGPNGSGWTMSACLRRIDT